LAELQLLPDGQVPHEIDPPQLSGKAPHSLPDGQAEIGAQLHVFVAVSHALPDGQVPHATEPPQPSG
jgi:hypothetical protein